MSGVLHPVGPEPEQTYWIRRALVLGSAVLLLVLLVSLVVNATSSGSASAAPPPVLVPGPASPTAATSPSVSASATPSAKATPTATSSAKATAKSSAPASAKPSASPSAKKTAKAKPAGPVACAPAGLRTTLTGEQKLKVKQHAALRLSLINGTGSTCVVTVTPATFAVTIYSGHDRIWSTADCATAVKPLTKKVADEDAVAWSLAWNGRRSAKGCHNRPEIPRAGTYIATAKLDGAKPVTMRMVLRG